MNIGEEQEETIIVEPLEVPEVVPEEGEPAPAQSWTLLARR